MKLLIYSSAFFLLMLVDACKTAQQQSANRPGDRTDGVAKPDLTLGRTYYDVQVGGTPNAGVSYQIYVEMQGTDPAWQLDSLLLTGRKLEVRRAGQPGTYLSGYSGKKDPQAPQDSLTLLWQRVEDGAIYRQRTAPPELREKIFMPSPAPGKER